MTIRQFSDAILFLAAVTVGLAVLAVGRLWYSVPTSLLIGGLALWVILCALLGKIIINKRRYAEASEEDGLPQDAVNVESVLANLIEEVAALRRSIDEMRSEIKDSVAAHANINEANDVNKLNTEVMYVESSYVYPESRIVKETVVEPVVLDATIKRALRDNRIDLYLQPVVKLPSRRIVFYEGLARIRDDQGDVLSPAAFASALSDGPLATALDSLLFVRAAGLMRQLEAKRPDLQIFCNLSRFAVLDAGFIGGLAQFLADQRERAAKLVFEITARDFQTLPEHALDRLSRLARLGCQLSVDQVESLEIRPAVLARAQVGFVKVSASVLAASRSLTEFARFKSELDRFGIQIIATHIEDERTVIDVLELGIEYGQGYLFGAPRQARIDTAKTAAA